MKLSKQFILFVAGGVLSAVVDIGSMQMALLAGASPVLASSAGYFVGLAFNYAFHARVTFAARTTLGSSIRFICLVGLNYLITVGSVKAAVWLVGQPLAGKLASLPAVAANTFLLGRFWVFRKDQG